jgi:serine/threonine protein kinase
MREEDEEEEANDARRRGKLFAFGALIGMGGAAKIYACRRVANGAPYSHADTFLMNVQRVDARYVIKVSPLSPSAANASAAARDDSASAALAAPPVHERASPWNGASAAMRRERDFYDAARRLRVVRERAPFPIGCYAGATLDGRRSFIAMERFDCDLRAHLSRAARSGSEIDHVVTSGPSDVVATEATTSLGPLARGSRACARYAARIRDARYAASRVLAALRYCHELGFAHGDVKSANVLVTYHAKFPFSLRHARIALSDFGLARRYVDADGAHWPYDETRRTYGTSAYMSVDAHRGVRSSRRSDIESFGWSCVEWFSDGGELPWTPRRASGGASRTDKSAILAAKLRAIESVAAIGWCPRRSTTSRRPTDRASQMRRVDDATANALLVACGYVARSDAYYAALATLVLSTDASVAMSGLLSCGEQSHAEARYDAEPPYDELTRLLTIDWSWWCVVDGACGATGAVFRDALTRPGVVEHGVDALTRPGVVEHGVDALTRGTGRAYERRDDEDDATYGSATI